MTTQGNLFGQPSAYGGREPLARCNDPPSAHRDDPVTSHKAAARVAKSGRRQRNREITLALVKAMPGLTGHELWARAADSQRAELRDHNELYRVLADLKNRGLLRQGHEPRVCTVRKTRMVTWLVVE